MINRFERKFVFKQTSAKNIEILIKLSKVGFYEIFYERYINNIYFDTINFDNYYDNIDGVSDRVKHRIRWYNDFFLNSKDAVFEIKRRKGLLVNKETLLLDNFHLNENINISKYLNQKCELQKKELIHNHNLFPVLINRYKRRYFLSRDKKFRATIDSNIEASSINRYTKFNFITFYENSVILELKYDISYDSEVNSITNLFKTRLNKNSKYVAAFEFLKNKI
tara:strand:+ start:82 stop:750 length:669 start_codon:yes stop_codon:yes gene_type:complete